MFGIDKELEAARMGDTLKKIRIIILVDLIIILIDSIIKKEHRLVLRVRGSKNRRELGVNFFRHYVVFFQTQEAQKTQETFFWKSNTICDIV